MYYNYTSGPYQQKSGFTDTEWYDKIKGDIDNGKPIFYAMWEADWSAGHAVVCDGYRNGNEMHLDLGWSGSGTAWYNLDSVSSGGYTWTIHGAVFNITPDNSPAKPNKTTNPIPQTGDTRQPIDVVLKWSDGGGAISYEVYFGTDNPPSNIYNGTSCLTNSFACGQLAHGTTYYWRINARNAGGITTGDIWTFTTGLPDLNKDDIIDFEDFAILAKHWLKSFVISDIVWVSIDDPGVSGHESFNGEMSKYETTNAQYCDYLNAAYVSNDIIVEGSYVKGANGNNPGTDYNGQAYYDLSGSGSTSDGVTNGAAARINWTGSTFTVDPGFENHPVTYISWYGATAFCNYYGYRLPSQWEWQAVADYDSSYTYGCGTNINNSIANYIGSNHPHGTTAVGSFGAYGYGMCDISGNVGEWTSSIAVSGYFTRGGTWVNIADDCSVFSPGVVRPEHMFHYMGFRVCRGDGIYINWVSINDPGVSGHEIFNGNMSKYETTNAQYCQFLNAALSSGDITVGTDSLIYGAIGSNGGADFEGKVYYNIAGSGYNFNGAANGGAARINYNGNEFTVDSGFENHPATYVTWHGATAFCNYYGWRLPTEWEWQAVADYDGTYTYGCGTTINNSMANYLESLHTDGTRLVGSFGTYGYGMCDMSGNVGEWTSTVVGTKGVTRGGVWLSIADDCSVFSRGLVLQEDAVYYMGFRVCR